MPNIKAFKVAALAGHAGAVYTLLQDPETDRIFYSGSGDGKVIRWDLSDPAQGVVIAMVKANIFSMLILPGRQKMLLGQMQGGIHVLDLKEKKEVRHLTYHQGGVFDIQFDSAGKRVLAAGGDGVLSVWNSEFSLLKAVQVSQKSIRQIARSSSKNIVAAGCSDNTAYVLDAGDFHVRYRLPDHRNSVFSACFSPDGKYLLTGSRDAYLRVWDAAHDFHLKEQIPAHLFTINCIVYSPDGRYFATASRDKTIKIWSAADFQLLKVIDREKLEGHVNSVNKLIWSGIHLISCSDDRSVMVWRIEG